MEVRKTKNKKIWKFIRQKLGKYGSLNKKIEKFGIFIVPLQKNREC